MKKIMMATDLSARSDRALERAVSLARVHGAELEIAHVVDEDLPDTLATAQILAAKTAIEAEVDRLDSANELRVSIHVVLGRPYSDILDLADQTNAEIIVLGVHRIDPVKDMFRGTTVERIIRAGELPVLLVRDRVAGPYGHAVVGVDFSVYSRRAVEFGLRFMPGGAFHLVHAYDVPFKGFLHGAGTRREVNKQHQDQFDRMIKEEMAAFLAGISGTPPKLERIMEEGVARAVISRQVERLKPELLVIGTHGRTGVAHAFLGSVAEDILKTPPCDVLVVKAW
ncbi:MAG: nucleotide-binding universal stress UspA family protein [Paracoccaceae bacterium]|jgi:nucleotide-binding universal stress UspA family protein